MRAGNALALRWEQIDFERGWIVLDKTKTNKRYKPPMSPALAVELRRWQALKLSRVWVFPSFVGKRRHVGHSFMRKLWGEAMTAAGVENLRRHDLRHHLVTSLRAAGLSPKAASLVSGHATTAMLERYEHPDYESARAAVGSLKDLTGISAGKK
jgi:integrase